MNNDHEGNLMNKGSTGVLRQLKDLKNGKKNGWKALVYLSLMTF